MIEATTGSRIAERFSGVIVELHPRHDSARELRSIGYRPKRSGLREVARSRPEGRCDVYLAREGHVAGG